MRINHNISALIGQGALRTQQASLAQSMEKLSTGLRINRASDDAAGLAVSETLRARIRGMGRAKANAADGVALLQIAEGGAGEIGNILQRMRELAIQSATDTLNNTDRSYTQAEFKQLLGEISRISRSTTYNGMSLLGGGPSSFGGGVGSPSVLHVGAGGAGIDRIAITIDAMTLGALGLSGDNDGDDETVSEPGEGEIVVSVDTAAHALSSLRALDFALKSVNTVRSDLGAYANRLEFALSDLSNQEYNTQDAESRIRDVDFAAETTRLSRSQILVQSATSMLAQANQAPQAVLALLSR